MIYAANEEHGWGIDLRRVASIWQGGCIIRAKLLESIVASLGQVAGKDQAANLLLLPYFAEKVGSLHHSARETVVYSILNQMAVPALSASITYFDGMKKKRGPANLIQAQRDFFGAHTYARLDKEGKFSTQWQ